MKHIELSTICNALEAQVHYGEAGIDPAEAFETLFQCWRKKLARQGRTIESTSRLWDRGWLTVRDAESLCDYCISGWQPPLLEQ